MGVFVEKYSEDGQTRWTKILVSGYSDHKVVEIFELANGETGILTDKVYYKLSETGDSLLSVDFGLNYTDSFSCGFAESNRLFMGYNQSIMVTDPDGVVLSEHHFSETIKDISGYQNHYYFLTENQMLRAGDDLTVTDSVDLSEYLSDSTLNVFTDNLCILVTGDRFVQLDLNTFQVLETAYEKPDKFRVSDVSVSDTVLLLTGTSAFGTSRGFVAKTWSLTGHTENHDLDIGVTNIAVDSVRAKQDEYTPDVYTLFWNATATVKNFGSEPVENFYITGKLIRLFICGYNVVFHPVTDVNLAPGDSITIPLGEISDGPFFVSDTNLINNTFRLNTMLPNDKIDRNKSNDESEITFFVPLGIDEPRFDKLNIYPNPTANQLTVKNVPLKSSWKLHSVNGSVITGGLTEKEEFSIDVSGLKSGIYLLRITGSDGNSMIRKVVVK